MEPEGKVDELEDNTSLFALRTALDNAIDRIHRVEMATIYKVGFWGFVLKYIYSFAAFVAATFRHFI